MIVFVALDRAPTRAPEAQRKLTATVGEFEAKLTDERDARLALERNSNASSRPSKLPWRASRAHVHLESSGAAFGRRIHAENMPCRTHLGIVTARR